MPRERCLAEVLTSGTERVLGAGRLAAPCAKGARCSHTGEYLPPDRYSHRHRNCNSFKASFAAAFKASFAAVWNGSLAFSQMERLREEDHEVVEITLIS